jgi:hypothetical protein
MGNSYLLIKKISGRHRWVFDKHTSHIIHVSEMLMLNAIYHYNAVSGEINSLYLFQLILLLLLLLRSYLVSIEKQKANIFSELN